jgi:hypothetical protein
MTKNLETIRKLGLGKDDTETVKINFEDEDYTFKMRPLTSGELSKLQSIEKKPLTVKIGMQNGVRQSVHTNDVDINTGEFTEAQAEAMYNAIALSLSVDGETIPAEEIKTFPAGVPEIIFKEVIRVSKLSEDDLTAIKSFRKD